jgi:hypothetical protein
VGYRKGRGIGAWQGEIPLSPPFSKCETGKGEKIIASPFEKGRQERDLKRSLNNK